jgi:hypothetical protein
LRFGTQNDLSLLVINGQNSPIFFVAGFLEATCTATEKGLPAMCRLMPKLLITQDSGIQVHQQIIFSHHPQHYQQIYIFAQKRN